MTAHRIVVYTDQVTPSGVPVFGRATRLLFWDLLECNRSAIVLEVAVGDQTVPVRLRDLYPLFGRLVGLPL